MIRQRFFAVLAVLVLALPWPALAAPAMLEPFTGASLAAPAGLHAKPKAVKLNAKALLAMRGGAEAELTLPDGAKHVVVADLVQDQGGGITSWVGHVKGAGNASRVIVTTGPGGSYGAFETPTGTYRLLPGGAHDWLVDMRGEAETVGREKGDDQRAPRPSMMRKSSRMGSPTVIEAKAGTTTPYLGKSTPTPNAVIDVMVVYTQGLANDLGANLMTRLNFLVTRANTAYADSDIAITLRLVGTAMTPYSDTTSDDTALKAITPVCTASLCGAAFDPSDFGGIESQRDANGADLVVLMRDGGAFSGSGLAWIGSSTPDPDYMYSVVTGCTQACEYLFIHELGHNMGNVHDRGTAAWQANTPTPPAGAYPYSFGYAFCASGRTSCDPYTAGSCTAEPECSTSDPSNFGDIMSYFYSSPRVYKFSNPAISCAGPSGIAVPCGIADGASNAADTAQSMNNNRFALSALKSPRVALAVSASVNPSNAGQAVTFVATATGANGAPTGTVDFLDGGAAIAGCSGVALSSGQATCSSATLAAGTHAITAKYSGDAMYPAQTSAAFSQTVNALQSASSTGTLPFSFTPATLDFGGQSMGTTSSTITVAVVNNGASAITIAGIAVSDPQFSQSNDCGTLAAGASCHVSIAFTPAVTPGAIGTTAAVSATLTFSTANGSASIAIAGQAERSLVTHYYEAILGRAPDAPGKIFWEAEAQRMVGLGADVNDAWPAMALAFFASGEYAARGRDDAGFVADLYATFFDRPADASGIAYWSGQIASGLPRDAVLASFMLSPEYRGFTQGLFGAPTVRPEVSLVTDFYRGLLGRLPDDAGMAYWLGQFRAAQCSGSAAVFAVSDAISRTFATGAEYASRNRTDAQYVADLYDAFVRRGADLAGLQYWVSQLASGAQTREQVRQAFLSSAEFTARVSTVASAACQP